jgi:hypothetical protein
VPIQHLLKTARSTPEEIGVLASAFDAARGSSWLIWLAQQGQRDPNRLRERAVEGI